MHAQSINASTVICSGSSLEQICHLISLAEREKLHLHYTTVAFSAKVTDEFYELVGDASMADKAPVSADCSPSFFSQIMLHGIFVVLAWGFFLPWGAFIARHMKHREPLWFHLHILFQVNWCALWLCVYNIISLVVLCL